MDIVVNTHIKLIKNAHWTVLVSLFCYLVIVAFTRFNINALFLGGGLGLLVCVHPIFNKKGFGILSASVIMLISVFTVQSIDHLYILEPIQAPIVMVFIPGLIWFIFKEKFLTYLD